MTKYKGLTSVQIKEVYEGVEKFKTKGISEKEYISWSYSMEDIIKLVSEISSKHNITMDKIYFELEETYDEFDMYLVYFRKPTDEEIKEYQKSLFKKAHKEKDELKILTVKVEKLRKRLEIYE